jgi:tetratricopeptide (TPR) repeat protein
MQRFMLVVLLTWAVNAGAQTPKAEYEKALDLIHAYNGSGDELERATKIAEQLMESQPQSGYGETLIAEMISTWQLQEGGQPIMASQTAYKFTVQALQLNPRFAQAHVARARVFLKSGKWAEAEQAVDAALRIDPNLSGAVFMRADMYRRANRVDEAETWYRKFIDGTPSPQRKSNGYAWMAGMFKDQAWGKPSERASYVAKARDAFQKSVDLDPQAPAKTVNYAIFLNNEAADFDAAALYAERALKIVEFPMARYHLAAARYQKLSTTAGNLDKAALRAALEEVLRATGMSLQETLRFCQGCSGIRARLETLTARLE